MLDKKPDSLEGLIAGITPEIYQKLKTAAELGKWETGEPLSEQQVAYCLQAVIAWEHKNLPQDQRTGYMDPGAACKSRPDTIVTDAVDSSARFPDNS